ncbi:MAG: histidine kinase N-terminal 7TM domain-containing protein [Desulfitobacteriia bacterium]|jgi:PAS domain S-box-containing protein
MEFQYIPYIWPLLASAAISLALAIYSFLFQRKAKGTKNFIFCMLAAVIWSVGNALEMTAVDLPTKLFWANVQYLAYCFAPLAVLTFSMQFTGFASLVRSKKIIGLAIIPALIVILVWTNDWHGLIRYNVYLDHSGSFPVIAKTYGPAFYLHIAYAYLLNISSSVLLIRTVFFTNSVYTKQAVALLVGLLLIMLPNLLYILGISPVTRFDIAPVFFAPAGLIFAWGIYRYKLLDLLPVARTKVFETMKTGVMVLDIQDRVLDMNPAVERIVGLRISRVVGWAVTAVCAEIPEILRVCSDSSRSRGEFSLTTNGVAKIYEVQLSPLNDRKGVMIGKLLVIHDITEKKQAEEEFLKQQRRLTAIEERESLAKDMHDNLGQVLSFINLQAQGIRQELLQADIDLVSVKLDKLIEVTQATHDEIRKFIKSARDSLSAEKDFLAAITKDIKAFKEQTGLGVELAIAKDFSGEAMEPVTRLNLLNIIKEALNNIRKHAEARTVRIAFSSEGKELRTTIEDDGRGFEVEGPKPNPETKFGLEIMQERALTIGGRLEIQSAPGKGCRINIFVPLKEENKSA